MTSLPRIAATLTLLALVGAGCPKPGSQPVGQTPPTNRPQATAPVLGFGKLPKPAAGTSAAGNTGARSAMMESSAVAPMAPSAMPLVATDMAVGVGGGATGVAVPGSTGKALPPPSPRPVAVEYTIAAELPTWGTNGDVLQTTQEKPDAAAARSLAMSSGVPNAALGDDATISSVSLQWKDADSMQWNFDAQNRMLSFWKETTSPANEQPQTEPPKFDQAEMIRIADAFLDAHGFSDIRQTGAEIDEQQYRILMDAAGAADGTAMPCPYLRSDVVPPTTPVAPEAANSAAVLTAPAMPADKMMYPPCGWWPQQVNVFYASKREGLAVVDVGGWPNRSNSVTVDIRTKQVTNGILQLDQKTVRSSYPLIDVETAKKRLQSGGLNPVWPWGSETGSIRVTIKTVELVWLRYDFWNGSNHDVYYLPALGVTGSVDRGIKGQEPEEYRTAIPLVADSAFDETPVPQPMPLPAVMMESAPVPTPPPAADPAAY